MGSRRVTFIITALSGLLVTAAVTIPVGAYLLFSYRYLAGSVQTEAELSSHAIDHLIASNPDLWPYEHVRLVDYLTRGSDWADTGHRHVLDARSRVIAEAGELPPAPAVQGEWPLVDAGVVVGRVVVSRSVRPLLVRSAILALLLLPLAFVGFALIQSLPLRAIREGEEALRASEARFRVLLERSSDPIFVFDSERRVQFWSPSATEVLGWTADEVAGRRLLDMGIIHPDDVPLLLETMRAVDAGEPDGPPPAIRHRHKNGSWRWLEGRGRSLLDHPAVRGVVVNLRDVTEQRRLEEQMRQAQKLESIGRLAGGVAHDFNNLLTVILSCSEGMWRDRRAGRPVDPADIEQVHQAGERARDLTRQLLAFARKQIISPVPLDLNDVVRSSERLLQRVLGEDVILRVRTQEKLWPVLCDPGQIEQVLMNLAVNARDAMPHGGTLAIETRNATSAGEDADAAVDEVFLVVRDTGVGMTPEIQEHLFEPFFTSKDVGKGTGLGLATVHGIVTQSGGRIRVDSAPGRGTSFELAFPRCARPPAAVQASVSGEEVRGTETVLVVEDDPQVRGVTERILRRGGFRVLSAASGGEAIVAAQESGSVDLVVSDVVMPGMNGRAMVDELRVLLPSLRVIYVSGHPQEVIAQRGVLLPGIEFLQKPFTPETLLSTVRRVLDTPG